MKKTYLIPTLEEMQWLNLNAICNGSADKGEQPVEGPGTGGMTPSNQSPRHL